jgi:hypothetical protein
VSGGVSPEYLLQLFRFGMDTLDIANVMGMPEAQVVRLIAYARDKERAERLKADAERARA